LKLFFFSSRRRHTISKRDWSSDVCSSDLEPIKTEILVLGAGPGGYTAAFYAADRGQKVTLVEQNPRLGGICLNTGCIPSKALLRSEERRVGKECGCRRCEEVVRREKATDI